MKSYKMIVSFTCEDEMQEKLENCKDKDKETLLEETLYTLLERPGFDLSVELYKEV